MKKREFRSSWGSQGAAVPVVAAWWRSEAGTAAWQRPLWLVVEKVVKSFKKLQSAELQAGQGAAVPAVAAWWRSEAGTAAWQRPLWLVV